MPVLLGVASFSEGGSQGVAFVLDLTERKRAEAEARESERRHRETQMQLAHANRLATMGQLTASIAHEVNQPITATVINAQTGLRWLGAEPLNLDEAREALWPHYEGRQTGGRRRRPDPQSHQEGAAARRARGDQCGDPRGDRASFVAKRRRTASRCRRNSPRAYR